MGRSAKSYDLSLLFAALADRTRLRLLNLIADREICVCYLVEILRISQPKVSRHLAYLRRAGMVASRREGKWMHYRLRMPADEGTAGPSAGTVASDLMSMRQPVSLAASLAFWPSLPIASDSW